MPPSILLSYAFRPFFLLAAAWAVIGLASWYALLQGISWPGAPVNVVFWHIHEMVFGFVGAAMAGFLLTAIATWTGRPPVQGIPIGILIATWVAGRLVSILSGGLPDLVVVPCALAFPLMLSFLVTREIVSARNRRNYIVVLVVSLFPLADLAYLVGGSDVTGPTLSSALYFMPHLVILLIAIIGGRITPAFTGNWLRTRGVDRLPLVRPWLDSSALAITLAVGLADSLSPLSVLTGVLALVAALVHGLRLAGWCGRATLSEPLLFILHVGYGWIVVGYLLLGSASFFSSIPSSSALHAITVGAMGTMILAVMTRVSLGHTGRDLHASRFTVALYAAVTVATVARIAAPLSGGGYLLLIEISAGAWIAAFAGFVWEYSRILTGPRVS
jgi:uncharacterized protein involved in response to NO